MITESPLRKQQFRELAKQTRRLAKAFSTLEREELEGLEILINQYDTGGALLCAVIDTEDLTRLANGLTRLANGQDSLLK